MVNLRRLSIILLYFKTYPMTPPLLKVGFQVRRESREVFRLDPRIPVPIPPRFRYPEFLEGLAYLDRMCVLMVHSF